MMPGFLLAVLLVAAVPQTPVTVAPETPLQGVIQFPAPDPNAPPIVDIALRQVRAVSGGSSIARSAVRGAEQAFLYSGLGPCVLGASATDPARDNSVTWRASGRVRSVERGIAVADVEWQRIDYGPAGVTAGPRVRTTLTLPLGERVSVDFLETSGSACRMDGLIFEIGIAPDHGMRLAMSAEGRSDTGGGGRGGGGAAGQSLTPAEWEAYLDRVRQAAAALAAAPVVTRPMPPRQYNADVWLVPGEPGASSSPGAPALAQRLSQVIGGTGGRFEFPPIPSDAAGKPSVVVDISALVIPVGGDQLIVAITRHVTPSTGASPVSSGWIKAVPMPKAGDVPSFEFPGYGLRLRLVHR